jgi:hypothetical protein
MHVAYWLNFWGSMACLAALAGQDSKGLIPHLLLALSFLMFVIFALKSNDCLKKGFQTTASLLLLALLSAPAGAETLLTTISTSFEPIWWEGFDQGTPSQFRLWAIAAEEADATLTFDLGPVFDIEFNGAGYPADFTVTATNLGVPFRFDAPTVAQFNDAFDDPQSTNGGELRAWFDRFESPHRLTVPFLDLWTDGDKISSGQVIPYTIDSNFLPPNGFSLNGSGHVLSAVELVVTDIQLVTETRIFESSPWSTEPMQFLTAVYYGLDFELRLYSHIPEPSTFAVTVGLLLCTGHRPTVRRVACSCRRTRP